MRPYGSPNQRMWGKKDYDACSLWTTRPDSEGGLPEGATLRASDSPADDERSRAFERGAAASRDRFFAAAVAAGPFPSTVLAVPTWDEDWIAENDAIAKECACTVGDGLADEPLSPEARKLLDQGLEDVRQGRVSPVPADFFDGWDDDE